MAITRERLLIVAKQLVYEMLNDRATWYHHDTGKSLLDTKIGEKVGPGMGTVAEPPKTECAR